MKSSSSVPEGQKRYVFRCNVCGRENDRACTELHRERSSCECGSTVRTRALTRMLSLELFGYELALPDFPVIKSVRGMGMSDAPDFAARIAAKFEYRNTEYDREPKLDIVNPGERDIGQYDFIISSEVLEHVVAPVDRAFANLFRLLKPHGVLLITVPYGLQEGTVEHFGPMEDFGLARVGEGHVLVRRAAGGSYEVFDNLVFHGGPGSTLEMRVFSERDLRAHFVRAGFSELRIYGEDCPEFGIVHSETWSLPMAARKEKWALDREALRWWSEQWEGQRVSLARGRSPAPMAVPPDAQAALDAAYGELQSRTEWVNSLQAQLNERTAWALAIDRELDWAKARVAELETHIARLQSGRWARLGRRLGAMRG